MNEPGYIPDHQAQTDARANLFYFLGTLARQAGGGRDGDQFREESPITNEQVETFLDGSAIPL